MSQESRFIGVKQMAESESVSVCTLDLLESRLGRLSFVLHGDIPNDELTLDTRSSAATRLRHLERQLSNLAARSSTASQVLDLQHSSPTLFHPSSELRAAEGMPSTTLATVVLTHAQAYQQLQQQLSTMDNLKIPEPTDLVPLVGLQAQINGAAVKQKELALRAARLRARSAAILELWYADGLLDMSEHWTSWEERLRDVEILVRRMEAAKKREIDVV